MITHTLLEGYSFRLLEDSVGIGKGFGNGYGFSFEKGGYGRGCFQSGAGDGRGNGNGRGEGSGHGVVGARGMLKAVYGNGGGESCGCRDNDIYIEKAVNPVYIVE